MFWTNLIIDVLLVFYVLDCIFLGFVIMMQRSKQEGLGAAFGGGFTESIWGAQTSQVLVKASVYAAIIFFALSIILARLYSVRASEAGQLSPVQQDLLTPLAAPAATTTSALPGVATNSAGTPVVPTATPVAPAPAAATAPVTTPAKPASK